MEMTTPMQSKPLVNATCKLGKKGCYEDGRCHYIGNCMSKIETNADRIRAMTDEELAKIIMCPYDNDHNNCVPGSNCLGCCLKWLQQPYEEGTV